MSRARSGRSVLASMTRQEQEQDGFRFGVIPWCDVTADGEEEATVPDAEDLREATLRFMRSSMTLAIATTAVLYDVRIAAIRNGTIAQLRKDPHVFPGFTPLVSEQGDGKGEH